MSVFEMLRALCSCIDDEYDVSRLFVTDVVGLHIWPRVKYHIFKNLRVICSVRYLANHFKEFSSKMHVHFYR